MTDPHYTAMEDFIEDCRMGGVIRFRPEKKSRRVELVDSTTALLAMKTWDVISVAVRERFLERFGCDPIRFCQVAWAAWHQRRGLHEY